MDKISIARRLAAYIQVNPTADQHAALAAVSMDAEHLEVMAQSLAAVDDPMGKTLAGELRQLAQQKKGLSGFSLGRA